jgi:hypothetical protein
MDVSEACFRGKLSIAHSGLHNVKIVKFKRDGFVMSKSLGKRE